jgi:DNA-binding transcriptional LysR family regulator
MDLRQLEHFIAVVDQGTFSAAAARLLVVQSAVSKAIRELERDLGTLLFERSAGSSRPRLTPVGEVLLPEARALLDRARTTRELVASTGESPAGHLDIGVMTVLGPVSLPGLLAAYRSLAPDVSVRLHVRPHGSADLLDGVLTGEFDLAFLAPTSPVPAGVRIDPVATIPLHLLVPAEHRVVGRPHVTLEDVAGERWIDSPPGYGNRSVTDEAFTRAGLARSVTLELYEIRQLPELVAAGLGVGLFPGDHDAHPGVVAVRLVERHRPALHIQLAVREGRRRPAVSAFLDALERVHSSDTAQNGPRRDGSG